MRKGILASGFALLAYGSIGFAQSPGAIERPAALSSNILATAGDTPAAAPALACSPELGCAPACEPCGPPGRFWASAEYLLWWIKDQPVPPLVTASPAGTPATSAGVIGVPGNAIIFGGSDLNDHAFSGGRLEFGFWLDDCHKAGLETDFFFLGTRRSDFDTGGTAAAGSTIIGRPIVSATGGEVAQLVNFPATLSGSVHVSAPTRMWGIEENVLCNLYCCGNCTGGTRIDLIAGFRYLELDEGLQISELLTVAPGVPAIGGTTIGVVDDFKTHNYFYGGQIGARAEFWRGNAFLNVTTKFALGDTHEVVDVNGFTTITPPGGPATTVPGGILALPSNIGRQERDAFSFVPEIGFNVGYQFTQNLRGFVGYTFLYWSDVVRPGEQIDRVVNLTQIPSNVGAGPIVGPARPAPMINATDFWAQGVNFGIEVRF
jgi:hypothetical protein